MTPPPAGGLMSTAPLPPIWNAEGITFWGVLPFQVRDVHPHDRAARRKANGHGRSILAADGRSHSAALLFCELCTDRSRRLTQGCGLPIKTERGRPAAASL